ncbi:MAG: transcriptional coactivator PipX [Xenococcaceae cyanobacterium]
MNNNSNETYLNHPTFGLLYRVCIVTEERELYTTLYAQRLFFVVTTKINHISVEPVGRTDARILVETRMRKLRSIDALTEYQELQAIYKRTF